MHGCLELEVLGMEHDNHCISITAIGNKFVAHCCVNSLQTFQLVWTQDPSDRAINAPISVIPYYSPMGQMVGIIWEVD